METKGANRNLFIFPRLFITEYEQILEAIQAFDTKVSYETCQAKIIVDWACQQSILYF